MENFLKSNNFANNYKILLFPLNNSTKNRKLILQEL